MTLVSQYQSEFALPAILGLPVSTTLLAPGVSTVIYGGCDATAISFEGIEAAPKVPDSQLRQFGKPQSYVKRRMGVVLARGSDVEEARAQASSCAAKVQPRAAASD